MEGCKRCLLLESAERPVWEQIREKVEKLPEDERCPEEIYRERLAACKGCDNLLSGMCLKCGCYVEFRAAFRRQNCPDAANRRWGPVA